MASSPPTWALAALWLRRSALARSGALRAGARVLPARATVRAQAVRLAHLAGAFAPRPLGAVLGVDHAALDAEVARGAASGLTFSFPLWQYELAPASAPVDLLKVDLQALAPHPDEPWAGGGPAGVSPSGSRFRCGAPAAPLPPLAGGVVVANAVVYWVDYDLDGEGRFVISTGAHGGLAVNSPGPGRQAVRFVDEAAGGALSAACWFDEERGNFELWSGRA
jgi:hypothetical protein